MSVPSAGLLDTSVFIARERGRMVAELPVHTSVSVITLGELQVGVLGASDAEQRTRRAEALNLARSLDVVPVNEWVADEWARLVSACRTKQVTGAVKRLDSIIAATAVALGVPVVTQDADFDQIAAAYPMLSVLHV